MNTRASRPTTRLLQRLSASLKRLVPKAMEGDDRAVHQARVTTRRLREAVPVLATGLKDGKPGKARRKVRRLTRALGTVRELDVTLSLLDELARVPHVPRPAVEDVRARVIEERDARRKVMLERLERVNLEKLDKRLRSVEAALEESAIEPWRKALGSRLLSRARKLGAAMDDAGNLYGPERLHAVRISAKKLRYGLELAADSGVQEAAAHVRTIKRAQDMLGKLHDLQVLQGHVGAVQSGSPQGRAQSRAALEDLARHIEDQCRHLHGRYVALVPALRDLISTVRKTIVPQLARTARRAPAVKMGLSRAPRGATVPNARSMAGDR
jgi:CHAD domain-containing protein